MIKFLAGGIIDAADMNSAFELLRSKFGTITNKDISPDARIAKSKLSSLRESAIVSLKAKKWDGIAVGKVTGTVNAPVPEMPHVPGAGGPGTAPPTGEAPPPPGGETPGGSPPSGGGEQPPPPGGGGL